MITRQHKFCIPMIPLREAPLTLTRHNHVVAKAFLLIKPEVKAKQEFPNDVTHAVSLKRTLH